MDPTVHRCQSSFKSSLRECVWLLAAYILPSASTVAFMTSMFLCGSPLSAAILFGIIYFWATTYEAVTAYFHGVALPLAIDLSLDPSPSEYCAIVYYRGLVGLALPTLVFSLPPLVHPLVPTIGGGLGIWLFAAIRETIRTERYGYPCIEAGSIGNRLKPLHLMRQRKIASGQAGEDTIPWGGLQLPMAELLKNFLVVGAVGTGKTLILKAFLTAILPLVVRYRNWRAVIVDPKGELAPTVQALVPRYKISILNPGDARTVVWAIAKDLRYEKHFHEAAYIMIPSIEEAQPFFSDGARSILQGTMISLAAQSPDNWHLADACIACQSLKRLETLLKHHSRTRDIYNSYAPNTRVWLDLYATLRTKIADLYPVAAVWSHVQREYPSRVVSLAEFVTGNNVLLLSMEASAGTSQGKILAMVVKRLSQLLFDQPTGQSTLDHRTSRRTAIVIDEAPRAGKLELLDLVTNGRDYGVGLLAAMQSVDAMLEHYPQDRWNALANEFHSLALLSTNSPTSLKWMSERLGNTDSHLPPANNGKISSTAGDWAPVLNPTQLHTLRQGKVISPTCVPGIFLNSDLGAWYSQAGVDIAKPLTSTPAHVPIPEHWNVLRPWDDDDLARLNLTHLRSELDLDNHPKKPGPPTPRRTPSGQSPSTSYPRFRT